MRRIPEPAPARQLTQRRRGGLRVVGVVPTIRREALRDAIEDYDYLARFVQLGQRAEADAIVAPLAGSFFSQEKNPVAYEKARPGLADLILPGPERC